MARLPTPCPYHQLAWHALFADMDSTVDRDNFYQRAVGAAAPSGNVGLVRNGLDPRNRFQGVVGAAGFTDPLRNSLFNWLPI